MKITRNLFLALAFGASALFSSIGSASASGADQAAKPPVRRAVHSACFTTTSVRLKARPNAEAEPIALLDARTRVLPRRRSNGFVFVNARAARGWLPVGSIECRETPA